MRFSKQAATGMAAVQAVEPGMPPQTEGAGGLASTAESWRVRLGGAGIACRALALYGPDPENRLDFPSSLAAISSQWEALREQVHAGNPMALSKADESPATDLLLVSVAQWPDGQSGVVGLVLAPPYSDRTVQLVLLAVGSLTLALQDPSTHRSLRAARLLDLLGHVASQDRARSAAQEWINRSAVWAREIASGPDFSCSLLLFDIRGGAPRWWVSSDTAWADPASPQVRDLAELAAQAAAEQQEVRFEQAWAVPVMDDGLAVAVLVARATGGAADMPEPIAVVLRASLGLAEPLLRHWREAERPLWRHHLDALRVAWRKLRGPGHLSWKLGALGTALASLLLLAWPVPDRVTASAVIEGRLRQLVTAPVDGFIGQVLVRPGARVAQGQLMARLDDRDLKLEQARARGEREQAAGRLRQAMADREAPAMAQALAEVQQADAQLGLVDSKLDRLALTAPRDGLVISGDWVQQIGGPVEIGKEMFEIAAGDGYRVVLHVPDRDIARVHAGQAGSMRLAGQPQEVHAFRISNLTGTASVQDGINGFRVEAEWVGDVPKLSPGMQGIGKVDVGRSNLLTIWTRSSVDWLRLKLWSWFW